MAKRSRDKGKRGEREVVALLKAHGFQARRGQQFRGGSDSPDIIHNLPGIYLEVKFRQYTSLVAALNKALQEGDMYMRPAVFHRQVRQPWLVTMYADDFLKLIKELKEW